MGLGSGGRSLAKNGLQLARKVAKAISAGQPSRLAHATGSSCVSGMLRGSTPAPCAIQPTPTNHAAAANRRYFCPDPTRTPGRQLKAPPLNAMDQLPVPSRDDRNLFPSCSAVETSRGSSADVNGDWP